MRAAYIRAPRRKRGNPMNMANNQEVVYTQSIKTHEMSANIKRT